MKTYTKLRNRLLENIHSFKKMVMQKHTLNNEIGYGKMSIFYKKVMMQANFLINGIIQEK